MPSGRIATDAVRGVASRTDWCTPLSVLERVRETLGAIELDPASNPTSIVDALVSVWLPEHVGLLRDVRADVLIGDGLAFDWGAARTYVNPPYSGAVNRRWARKIADAAKSGAEIVALVPGSPGAQWWLPYRPKSGGGESDGVCIYDRRVTFLGADAPAAFDVAAVYFGPHVERFAKAFASAGWVIR